MNESVTILGNIMLDGVDDEGEYFNVELYGTDRVEIMASHETGLIELDRETAIALATRILEILK